MKRIEDPIHDTVNHLVRKYGARPILRDEAFAYHKAGWAVIVTIDNLLFDRSYWCENDEDVIELLDPSRDRFGLVVYLALSVDNARRAVGMKVGA